MQTSCMHAAGITCITAIAVDGLSVYIYYIATKTTVYR